VEYNVQAAREKTAVAKETNKQEIAPKRWTGKICTLQYRTTCQYKDQGYDDDM